MFPLENFEFLDSLELYFTYFRTRFEEKLLPQKAIFKLGDLFNRKNIFYITLCCTVTQIRRALRCLTFHNFPGDPPSRHSMG